MHAAPVAGQIDPHARDCMQSEANTGPMGNRDDTQGLTGQTWFRPAVAVWFALLLGGGLWLMPPGVHEGLARGLALPRISPVFAAPLGPASLAILCGAFALFGAALGWAVAHRVAEFSRPRPFAPDVEPRRRKRRDAQVEEPAEPVRRRRVFSASEDIGEDGIAAPEAVEEGTGTATAVSYDFDDAPASSASEFDSVYAELAGDYTPSGDNAEPAQDWDDEEPEPTEHALPDPESGDVAAIEYAEYEPADDEGPEPDAESGWGGSSAAEAPAHDLTETAMGEQRERADDEVQDYGYDGDETGSLDETPVVGDDADHRSQPEDLTEGLDGMSLEALLGRLEDALETHGAMVADSERAASEPPPQTVPMARTGMATPLPMADHPGEATAPEDEDDPVIAFLRREASRRMPDAQPLPTADYDEEEYHEEEYGDEDHDPGGQHSAEADEVRPENETHNALRNALERLGQGARRS